MGSMRTFFRDESQPGAASQVLLPAWTTQRYCEVWLAPVESVASTRRTATPPPESAETSNQVFEPAWKPESSWNSPVRSLPTELSHCAEIEPAPNFAEPSVITMALPSRSRPPPNTAWPPFASVVRHASKPLGFRYAARNEATSFLSSTRVNLPTSSVPRRGSSNIVTMYRASSATL